MVNGTTTRSPTLSFLLLRADFDDFAHRLVADDVAAFHVGDDAVEDVQVGAADRAGRHLDDGVARMLDLRDRERVSQRMSFLPCQVSAFMDCSKELFDKTKRERSGLFLF